MGATHLHENLMQRSEGLLERLAAQHACLFHKQLAHPELARVEEVLRNHLLRKIARVHVIILGIQQVCSSAVQPPVRVKCVEDQGLAEIAHTCTVTW